MIENVNGLVGYIRQVRTSIRQSATVSDAYNFWNKRQAKQIADEVDFIGLHAYAL